MNSASLSGIRACVFDAYGTLFDVASATARSADIPGPEAARLTALWRDKQLQYTWLRALEGKHADFWQVTRDALDFALETLGIGNTGLRQRLMNLYLTLSLYPEVLQTLRRLRDSGVAIAILSNGSPAMLAAAVEAAGLEVLLDAVMSVEEVGVYKPHPKVYQLAVDRFGVPAQEIAFVSSNGWDAYAASAFGMRTIWCNRQGQPRERLPGAPEREIPTLAELPTFIAAGANPRAPR
ncbi:MAG: haloacid dehalogenase type II [Alphaproteobacteria bacterium]|nr:haloacid dehalogenase type II [Alphaproteobacteria bacterium]